MSDEIVPVGRVGRPHGIDGSFVVEQGSEDERRFAVGAVVLVDGQPAKVVSSKRSGGGRRAIRLDREAPRGATLAVRRDELPEPEQDAFYVFQLIGLSVEGSDGRVLGTVKDVLPGAANDSLELEDGTLLPLIDDCVREVDVAAGRIVVDARFVDED